MKSALYFQSIVAGWGILSLVFFAASDFQQDFWVGSAILSSSLGIVGLLLSSFRFLKKWRLYSSRERVIMICSITINVSIICVVLCFLYHVSI